jgi:activating signal cointegrator 1
MKAISLWQPWASFIAAGIKPFETRDWPPPKWMVGQTIAIHAAKKPANGDLREWAAKHGCTDLPLGAIVCTARLHGAYQCGFTTGRHVSVIDERTNSVRSFPPALTKGGIAHDEFGDYSTDRWAWLLTDIDHFEKPIVARGSQGFWNWEPP